MIYGRSFRQVDGADSHNACMRNTCGHEHGRTSCPQPRNTGSPLGRRTDHQKPAGDMHLRRETLCWNQIRCTAWRYIMESWKDPCQASWRQGSEWLFSSSKRITTLKYGYHLYLWAWELHCRSRQNWVTSRSLRLLFWQKEPPYLHFVRLNLVWL